MDSLAFRSCSRSLNVLFGLDGSGGGKMVNLGCGSALVFLRAKGCDAHGVWTRAVDIGPGKAQMQALPGLRLRPGARRLGF